MSIFLAGLRSIDDEVIKAAKVDGASTISIYMKIVLPMMRPVFMSAIVILVHLSIKSYDLVIALTAGGPGISSDMPAVFMTKMAFGRSEIGLASASAIKSGILAVKSDLSNQSAIASFNSVNVPNAIILFL